MHCKRHSRLVSILIRHAACYALCLELLMFCAANGHAAIIAEVEPQSIDVAAHEWEGQTNADGSGLYFDLLRAVYRPLGIQVRARTLPFNRVVALLRTQRIDASVGFYSAETAQQIDWHFYATPNRPIDSERLVAIFKKGTLQEWNFPASLARKRVAWIDGYGYERAMQVEVEHQKITTQAQGWNLLRAGRIDAYLDSESDAIAAAEANGIDLNDYQCETIVRENLYVPFALTKKGQRLMRLFDQRMEELHNSGELAELYRHWRKDPPPWE